MWTKTYKVVGFLEPGVVRFGDSDGKDLMIYISKQAIDRYAHRIKGKPITVGHIGGITEANAQQYSVGDVALCTDPGDCIVTINNEKANDKIESGERFSCCWIPIRWGPGGTWHNIPYDRELLEMDFTHLAIVPDPRYENVEVFMNSKSCKKKMTAKQILNMAKEFRNANRPSHLTYNSPFNTSQMPRKEGEAAKRLMRSKLGGMAPSVYAENVHNLRQERAQRETSYGSPKHAHAELHANINKKQSFNNSFCSKKTRFRYKDGREFDNNKFQQALKSAPRGLKYDLLTEREVQQDYRREIGKYPQYAGGESGQLKVTKGQQHLR